MTQPALGPDRGAVLASPEEPLYVVLHLDRFLAAALRAEQVFEPCHAHDSTSGCGDVVCAQSHTRPDDDPSPPKERLPSPDAAAAGRPHVLAWIPPGTVVCRALINDPASGRVHYDGMQSEQRDPSDLELYVTPAPPGEGALLVRMSPQIADEVRALLDESGLDHSRAAEFSSGAELALESVRVLGAAGGAAALGRVS